MKIMPDRGTIYYDIDSTLVEVELADDNYGVDDLIVKLFGINHRIYPKYEVIEQLKSHKQQGFTVAVWHDGGTEYAVKVINKLKLAKYVDLIIPKPLILYDDLKPSEFLDARRVDPESLGEEND